MKEKFPGAKKPEKSGVIPIERGEALRLERLRNKILAEQKALSDLLSEISKADAWREALLQEEFKKPRAGRNNDLIDALNMERAELDQHETEVLESYSEGQRLLEETRERILNAMEIEMTKQYLIEVKRLLAERTKK